MPSHLWPSQIQVVNIVRVYLDNIACTDPAANPFHMSCTVFHRMDYVSVGRVHATRKHANNRNGKKPITMWNQWKPAEKYKIDFPPPPPFSNRTIWIGCCWRRRGACAFMCNVRLFYESLRIGARETTMATRARGMRNEQSIWAHAHLMSRSNR